MVFLPAIALLLQTPVDSVLDRLVGDWKSVETTTGRDGKDLKFTLDGKNRMVLKGQYLQIDEVLHLPKGESEENHILMSIDPKAKLYRAYWFYTSGPTPFEFTGPVDGNKLTLTCEKPALQISYNFDRDGHYLATVSVKRGETWTVVTRAEYTRQRR